MSVQAVVARNVETKQPEVWCDGKILFLVGALMAFGVAMVYSASVTVRGAEFDWRQWWNSPLKQCIFTLGGFFVMIVAAHVDYRSLAWFQRGDGWRAGAVWLLAAGLLVAMLIPGIGRVQLGAQRSIVLYDGAFSLGFQPAEFAKVALVIWLAALLTRPGVDVKNFGQGFLLSVVTGGVLIGLAGIEDFGTAALMGTVMLMLLILAGAKWRHLGLIVLLGALAAGALIWHKPYRVQRLVTFFSQAPDPTDEGYQVTQSLIAIGSGGWWGKGLGNGVQKYGYLPHDNNDFILAIVCEELGVAGGLAVIVVFLLLLWRGWRLSATAIDPFGRLLAAGLTLMVCLQAAFNIAVVTNSIPTKGISLPFVSAGGSGILFLGLAAGLLAAVGRRQAT